MAIGNKAKETKSTTTDKEVLGYWNPRGLVSKSGLNPFISRANF